MPPFVNARILLSNLGRTPRLLALLPFAISLSGCWTSLTTPKESFLYEPSDKATPVVEAPRYQKMLEEIEAKNGPELYRLVVGTRLLLEVYGHGIRETIHVRPDGRVDLPLIGDVVAENKTIPQLKQEISGLYQPFFQQKPQIIINTERDSDVVATGVRAGDVSVINPAASGIGNSSGGVVNISGDERLSQVLATVNALNPRSEWRQIAVIRQDRARKDSVIVLCDLERLLKYGDLRQDLRMRNGDIVFIPIERNTVLQEIWATFNLVAQLTSDANTITDYIERIERY